MPTGYTAALYEGEDQTFEEFVLRCARAMGAAIMQRDSGPGPIADEYQPSTYHAEALKKAAARLTAVDGWDDDEATAEAAVAYHDAKRRDDESRATTRLREARYQAMLLKVKAWPPPTPEHEGLKRFMAEQLTESIDFDCRGNWPAPVRLDGAAYREQERDRALRDIEYNARHQAEEEERTRERNAWVRALRGSL